jgi:hypothetical protein
LMRGINRHIVPTTVPANVKSVRNPPVALGRGMEGSRHDNTANCRQRNSDASHVDSPLELEFYPHKLKEAAPAANYPIMVLLAYSSKEP